MRPVRLKTRSGIGIRVLRAVESETIKCSRARLDRAGEITRWLSLQGLASAVDDHLQTLCLRRPDPEMRLAIDEFHPNRIAAFHSRLRHRTPSIARAVAVVHFSHRWIARSDERCL